MVARNLKQNNDNLENEISSHTRLCVSTATFAVVV